MCHFCGGPAGTHHCGHRLVVGCSWHCTPQQPVPGISPGSNLSAMINKVWKMRASRVSCKHALLMTDHRALPQDIIQTIQIKCHAAIQCVTATADLKNKVQKPQQDKNEKEPLPDDDGGTSRRTNPCSLPRNKHGTLKTSTHKHRSFCSIHQSQLNPHMTSFPPGTVSLQGFDTTLQQHL